MVVGSVFLKPLLDLLSSLLVFDNDVTTLLSQGTSGRGYTVDEVQGLEKGRRTQGICPTPSLSTGKSVSLGITKTCV